MRNNINRSSQHSQHPQSGGALASMGAEICDHTFLKKSRGSTIEPIEMDDGADFHRSGHC